MSSRFIFLSLPGQTPCYFLLPSHRPIFQIGDSNTFIPTHTHTHIQSATLPISIFVLQQRYLNWKYHQRCRLHILFYDVMPDRGKRGFKKNLVARVWGEGKGMTVSLFRSLSLLASISITKGCRKHKLHSYMAVNFNTYLLECYLVIYAMAFRQMKRMNENAHDLKQNRNTPQFIVFYTLIKDL